MADNLSVSVTADTSELRAQLALAQADLRAFGAETRNLANTIRLGGDAGGVLRGQLEQVAGQLGAAKSNVIQLTTALRDGTRAHAEHATGIKAINEAIGGMTAPIGVAVGGLKEFAEVAGVAFVAEAVGRIFEFAKSMAELGEKTEIMAAAVGTTPEEFSRLSATLEIAGGDADNASRVLEHLGKSVGAALRQPTGQTADAFHRLGISQDELQKHSNDLIGLLHLLAERWGAYQDSLTKTEAAHEIAGRGMDKLIPLLHKGAEGFAETEQKARDVGATLSSQTIKALAESAEHMNTLGAAAKGLGANLVANLTPVINGVTSALTAMIAAFNRAISLKSFAEVQTQHVDQLTAKLRDTEAEIERVQSAQSKASAGGYATQGPYAAIGAAAGPLGGKDLAGLQARADELRKEIELEKELVREHERGTALGTSDRRPTVAPPAPTEKGGGRGRAAKAEKDTSAADQRELDKELADEQRSRLQALDSEQKILDTRVTRVKAALDGQRQLGKISAGEEIADEKVLLDLKWVLDQEYFAKKLSAAQGDVKERQKLQEEEKLAYEKFLNEKQALEIKAAEESKRVQDSLAQSLVGPLKSAIQSSAVGVAQGTQTLGQAGQNVGNAVLAAAINKLSDTLLNKLGEIFTSLLPEALKSALGIGQQAASTAAITAAIATGATTTDTAIAAGAAATTAAISASTAAIVAGLAAIAVKPEIAGFSYARGGIVPSAAGGWVVPSFADGGILSVLHRNEMVLPANISQFVQGAAAQYRGGGGNVTYSPTINAGGGGLSRAQFSELLSRSHSELSGIAANAYRNGWRP
jgi:hypothetical protein